MPHLQTLNGSPMTWARLEELRQDYYARKRLADSRPPGERYGHRVIRLTPSGRALLADLRTIP